MGEGEGKEKYLFFHPTSPYPASAPTFYRSSIQVTIQDGGIEPIYLAFLSEITPALQARNISLFISLISIFSLIIWKLFHISFIYTT